MSSPTSPSEIARETLRALALRKMQPTPENYRAIFNEIGGVADAPEPAQALGAVLSQHQAFGSALAARAQAAAAAGEWDLFVAIFERALAAPKPAEPKTPEPEAPVRGSPLLAELHEQIARLVEFALPALGEDDAKIVPDARALAEFCRQNAEFGSMAPLKAKLSAFNHRLSFVADDQAEIKSSLLTMLHMVFENIAELSLDDRWLHGQIELLMAASSPPLTLRRLDGLKARLADLIFKQTELKGRHFAAQEEMKSLLGFFIEKLSDMAELSGSHAQRIEAAAKQVERAADLSDVGPALSEALSATRVIAIDSLRARDALTDMRSKAETSAAEVEKLRVELDKASSAARHDPLTGALNRRGLEEAADKEASRARRSGQPLCVALLDLDNFKKLNDVHGHGAGDNALTHLANVAREAMRPQDTLARYGGEEFVILMPDTLLEEGVHAMVRLQRELTRRFFMAGEQKLLITFSAGVSELAEQETHEQAIERADKGMYQAKRTGKNKVVAA
jgi:diguanylate cyclase